jgi:hypothetical protein
MGKILMTNIEKFNTIDTIDELCYQLENELFTLHSMGIEDIHTIEPILDGLADDKYKWVSILANDNFEMYYNKNTNDLIIEMKNNSIILDDEFMYKLNTLFKAKNRIESIINKLIAIS